MTDRMSRREWMTSTAAGLAVPAWLSAGAVGAAPSKNDRLVAGVIGSGGRGTSMAFSQFARFADVVAICDADLRRARRSVKIIEEKCGAKPEIYQDYRDLLDRSDIQVVGNATPDHWHTKINIDACRAGKDVYAEKPLALTIDEGKRLRDVVRETGRIVQVGTQQRSRPQQFRVACELVRNGRIGRLRQVGVMLPFVADCKPMAKPFPSESIPPELDWDLWQGQAPAHYYCRRRLAFRRWHPFSSGMVTDWGQHHFDIAHWAMRMDDSGPLSVDARGNLSEIHKVDNFNNIDVFAAHLKYPGDVDVWCMTVRDEKYLKSLAEGYPTADADARIYAGVPDVIKSETRNGVLFIGDDGAIFVNRKELTGPAVDELKTNPLPADAERVYASTAHMGNLIDCVKTRQQPISTVDIAHRSVTPCHLVDISMRMQRKLTWDAAKEQIVGDDEANSRLSRPQRAPYTIG